MRLLILRWVVMGAGLDGRPGQVIEVDDAVARSLMASGAAAPAPGDDETAAMSPPEAAVQPARGRRRQR